LRSAKVAREATRVTAALTAAAVTSATVFVGADLIGLLFLPDDPKLLRITLEHILLLWPPAFIVAVVHAVGLGLPAYLVLKRIGATRWWVSLPAGFFIGALPYAVLALPWSLPPNLPPFTWPHYVAFAGGFGLLGMAGGAAAWLVWHAMRRNGEAAAA
jgi:hypothetical protein